MWYELAIANGVEQLIATQRAKELEAAKNKDKATGKNLLRRTDLRQDSPANQPREVDNQAGQAQDRPLPNRPHQVETSTWKRPPLRQQHDE
eukprot:scaffold41741_cov15-Prasinocladus_malaysianus.AAC.1